MAVRFKRYFPQCRGIACNGRRSSRCPETPRKTNGEYKTCGAWAIEYRELDGRWVSKIFPRVKKTHATELYEEVKARVRRGIPGIPQKGVYRCE